MVATADQLATQAGMTALALGGNAVDAALAASAAIAVCDPHLNGLGGDLLALVHHRGEVHALNASGHAGSGADAAAMRADGHAEMPLRHDIRTVTVPGYVDGWLALHERFATLAADALLGPAIDLAENGFPAGPLLLGSLAGLDAAGLRNLAEVASQAARPGARVHRPGVARTLRAVAARGREAFYGGEFGDGLLTMGGGWFATADLSRCQADWVTPIGAPAWGVDLWTMPPNSQGYLAISAAQLADGLDVPADPGDERWAHLLIEAATAVGFDRPDVLHEGADGEQLVRERAARGHLVDPVRASARWAPATDGDTTYLCTADGEMGVSMIQSNASGFGSWLVEPRTGINLHNRGLGFSLQPGHPAELTPGRRPPHTLVPAVATRGEARELDAVFGSMGGDAQPQIVLQLAARLFLHGQSPAEALHAGRWALRGPVTGFDSWTAPVGPTVAVEGHSPPGWLAALTARGHRVSAAPAFDSSFGHAHAIRRDAAGFLVGAADPRARVGAVAGR
ncbi:MAG: putative gamma-glutamyltranspeptidase [Ilumatobacteraceae bacterium]|nr:putative gamma-glutamyltranspeptidase [Ilumatobacteraceae bacterium]